jgi:hypothetical protein
MTQEAFDWAPKKKPTHDERAHELVREHAVVLDTFVRLARERMASGEKRVGAKALVEIMRWELRTYTGDGPFRFDNSLTAPLVRIACHCAPDIAHLFQMKRRRR